MTEPTPPADQNAAPEHANPGAQGDAGKPTVEFTPDQQREIGRLLSKERKTAADAARTAADAERAAAEEQARKDREADDAKKRGDFESVETRLKVEAKAAKDEASGLKAENDRLRAAMGAGVAARWDALPDAVKAMGARFIREDDVLARWEFLHDEATAKAVADLGPRDRSRGNGPDPKTEGGTTPNLQQTIDEMRRAKGIRR